MKPSKRTVAYLLEYPLDLPGGAQMSTISLCTSLVDSSYEPVVICPDLLKKKPEDYPFRVITYDMGENRIGNLLKRIRAFSSILGELKPDIVHIQMPESLVTYALCRIRPEKKGGPVLIFTDRGLFFGYRAHTMFLMKKALKKARLMLTTTELNRRMWQESGIIADVRKVSNTISDSFSAYDPKRRQELFEKREGVLTLGLAGRICEEKNWPFAVSLIEGAAKRGIRFRVSLVLSLFEKGDEERARQVVDGITSAIGAENLEYFRDLSQDQMQDYYYGVDIFVMTSQFESFGKAAVEAMSRRCAVIATRVGGLPEVVGRDENLYDADAPEKALDYIESRWKDRDALEEDMEYFFRRYEDMFSRERCRSAHMQIYDEVSLGKG